MAAERNELGARRLLRLFGLYAKLDLLFVARGLREAIGWFVSDAIVAVAGVTATFLLAARFDGIGSWSREHVIFMLGFALASRGLVDVFGGFNVSVISRRIGRGQLDHSLVQPLPLWAVLVTEGFTPVTGSGSLLAGSALLVYATAGTSTTVTPGWLLALGVNLAAAAAIFLAFSYAWASVAFWAPRGGEEINSETFRMMDELRVFPLDGVRPALQAILLTAVPAGLTAWFPARTLLSPEGVGLLAAATPAAALVACSLAALIFTRGLKHYGRTGSSRYLAWGHRR